MKVIVEQGLKFGGGRGGRTSAEGRGVGSWHCSKFHTMDTYKNEICNV